jgi:hypothetical protein
MIRLIRSLSTLLIALLCCLFFVGPVAATSTSPDGNDMVQNIPADVPEEVLERAYQVELQHLARQDRFLTKAAAFLDRAETFIASLREAGYDTTALEEAVESGRASLAEARTEWTAAKAVLEEGAGFDEDGEVVDPALARTTLETAFGHMRRVHEIGAEALATLQAAIDEFRQDNPDLVFPRRPAAPPAPQLSLVER